MSIIAEISSRQCYSRESSFYKSQVKRSSQGALFHCTRYWWQALSYSYYPPPLCYLIILVHPHSQMGWAWNWVGRVRKEKLPSTNVACDGGPTQPARSTAAEGGSPCFAALRPWTPCHAPPVALVSLSPAFGVSCDLSRPVTSMSLAGSPTAAALLLVLVDLTTYADVFFCSCLRLLLISNATVSD